MLKMLKKKVSKVKKSVVLGVGALMMMATPAFATEPTTDLQLNFDITQMFQYAQMIIDALMPVIYITLGIALGFIVIRALKSAFS